MNIAEFIRENILRPRLREAGCLVVYDADRRYRELSVELRADKTRVVDASDSSIESRESALQALRDVGQPRTSLESLLIYVPAKAPTTDDQRQQDPFALYAECGAVFPRDDGDEYVNLCLRAKPDYATEIRRVFADAPGGPPFGVIDAIGEGISWPQLRALLKVESGREILVALMVPTVTQASELKATESWDQEARDFLRTTLGLSLKTRAKTWTPVADELWRYVLFSEFAFDLPVALPDSLKDVPRAMPEARPIVDDICDQLRDGPKTRATYIERAEAIEAELKLPSACVAIDDLGERDTFPFEERTFFRAAIKGIGTDDTDTTRKILARQQRSVWMGKGESQAQWDLVRAGLALVKACEDFDQHLPGHSRSQSELLDFYVGTLREADRLQREFEQAVGDCLDPHGVMGELIQQARARYRRLSEHVQGVFVRHLETSGWPPSGRQANVDTFDRFVAERLAERGRKIAYLMVDALRYELGVALQKLLAEDGPVELQATYAQLPTITPVGMASLLPRAGSELALALEGDALVPKLLGVPAGNVRQRMDLLARRFGDRFAELTLSDFVRGKPKIADTVDLLVLRSTEIDSHLEANPDTTLGLISGTLKLIRVALHKLRGMAFKEAVIATDHGFFLNAQAEAGDVCAKPQGAWPVNAHDRMMLGSGSSDGHSLVLSSDRLGIRGDFRSAAMPRSMAPYRAGHLYFHGGASLPEAVVPVLVVRLDTAAPPEPRMVRVVLSYRNDATRITTRVPVIDVTLVSEDMFAQETNVEILLEAQDSKGNVVGEPRPGGDVDPATRTLTLMPGQRKQIALRMDPDFEGKLTVKALNPNTLSSYCNLKLETDYTV